MAMRLRPFAVCLALSLPAAASAELRDYCPDRPGLGTPACTIDAGHASAEIGLADWTLDRSRTERNETLLLGDMLLRYGLDDRSEVQIGWTSFGRERDRDRLTGVRSTQSGVGDVTLALRRNLAHPDGSGFAAAVMPFVSLPAGGQAIGAGDWGAGFRVPLSWELADGFGLEFVPEVDAAVDQDRHGRHLAYSFVTGFEAEINDALTATAEVQVVRDRDPAGHETQPVAGLSLAWQPRDDLQLDIGANGGLNHHAPDVELYVGVSRRF
jgi:hypothetical protein